LPERPDTEDTSMQPASWSPLLSSRPASSYWPCLCSGALQGVAGVCSCFAKGRKPSRRRSP